MEQNSQSPQQIPLTKAPSQEIKRLEGSAQIIIIIRTCFKLGPLLSFFYVYLYSSSLYVQLG